MGAQEEFAGGSERVKSQPVCVTFHSQWLKTKTKQQQNHPPAHPPPGRILKLVGGTCGAVLIFLMPGALLVSYAHSKHRESCQRQQQHAAAAAATALEAQLGAPLLGQAGEAAGSPLFCLWCSKHFWAGVLLIMISAGLMVLTVITSLHPMAIN